MEKLFYKMPSTIGEELESQIKYCKRIGKFKNNDEISLEIRKLEKEVFGATRKYVSKDEDINSNDNERNSRAAVITELKKIGVNQQISNYFLLFSSFKALNIIREDYNIIKLLDYYRIKPKKIVDIERLEELRKKYKFPNGVPLNFCCLKKSKNLCNDKDKCINLRIIKLIQSLSNEKQIEKLYQMGLQSNFYKMITEISPVYFISIETLKQILKELDEKEMLIYIQENESKYRKPSIEWKQKKVNEQKMLTERIKKQKREITELKNDLKIFDRKKLNKLILKEREYEHNKVRRENINSRLNDGENNKIDTVKGLVLQKCKEQGLICGEKRTN